MITRAWIKLLIYLKRKEVNKLKLMKIISQHRRDFSGIYKCEGCGNEEENSGYDDRNFHDNVAPNWKCEKCGKTSKESGVESRVSTKYSDFEIV